MSCISFEFQHLSQHELELIRKHDKLMYNDS